MGGLWKTAHGQAAIGYFVYGLIYMAGAIRELDESRMRNFVGGTVPWWVFYVLGALFVVLFPILVARGFRILSLVLAILTSIKALYLFYGLGSAFSPFNLFFALVAMVASVLLVRAFATPRPQ